MAESEKELKSLLIKVKQENEKAGLNLNIQKTKIMASGPITLWQIDGEKVKQWQILFEPTWGSHVGLKLNIQKTKIMASGPITSWQIDVKQWKQWQNFLCVGVVPKPLWMVTATMKLKDTYLEKAMATHSNTLA